MLRTLFNKAAKPPYLAEKPVVLVSTMGDDPTRGDSHGYIGMGRLIAEKLGGSYHYVDEDLLRERYPDLTDPQDGLTAFINEIGTPDILFSRYAYNYCADGNPRIPYRINEINENLVPFFSTLRDVVAHHLTPSILEEEGRKFAAAYPGLPRPLVAVMMADATQGHLPQILPLALGDFDQSTVFVCSGRRTYPDAYHRMTMDLEEATARLGMADRVRVTGYEFNAGRIMNAYNPYMGLLDQADHIIICGSSHSIVSESLATGKTVHLHHTENEFARLEKKGLADIFNAHAENKKLETRKIKPLNRTEFLAMRIVSQYRHHHQRKLGFFGALGAYLMDG